MKTILGKCPYCQSSVGIEHGELTHVFEPSGKPCPHLVTVAMDAWQQNYESEQCWGSRRYCVDWWHPRILHRHDCKGAPMIQFLESLPPPHPLYQLGLQGWQGVHVGKEGRSPMPTETCIRFVGWLVFAEDAGSFIEQLACNLPPRLLSKI